MSKQRNDEAHPLPDEAIMQMAQGLIDGLSLGNVRNMDKSFIEGLYNLAYNLYSSGNYADAEKVFQFLSHSSHNEYRFWMGLAGCRQGLGKYAEAVDAYSMAGLVDYLKNPVPFLYGVRCYMSLGDTERAINGLKDLLALEITETMENLACMQSARQLLQLLEAQEMQ